MIKNHTEITFQSNEWNIEHTENFQIGLMTKVETYPSTREIINLLMKLGGLPAETNIESDILLQVAQCLSQNSQTIHNWLYKLIWQKKTLSYTDRVHEIAFMMVKGNDGISTLQNDVLELQFPEGRRMCDASTIISCLYLFGRLDESKRTYEPFELKNAADLILVNGIQMAEYLSEQARLGRGMMVVKRELPDAQEDDHYYEEEYDYNAPAYFRADPRMRNEISYC